MKRVFVFVSVFVMALFFTACGKSDFEIVMANMSERMDIYFFGQNDQICISLACGEREVNYFMDGSSGEKTEFSLVTISFFEDMDFENISVIISIDDFEFEQELEYVPTASGFMCDLQKSVSGSEKIEIKYKNNVILLENISKNFGVNNNKAIEIACEEFKEKIGEIRKGTTFSGECYLKILDKRRNNFADFFWCFTLIDKNGNSLSVVVSTVDGKILAKS